MLLALAKKSFAKRLFGVLPKYAVPAQRVGARLDHQVGHATFGVPDAGVERRGLDLELLDDVGRRHVRSDDLAGVRRRRARHAVNRQVAAVAARAVHRVADDVRRLEGPVETRRARVGDAGREADERVRDRRAASAAGRCGANRRTLPSDAFVVSRSGVSAVTVTASTVWPTASDDSTSSLSAMRTLDFARGLLEAL